MKILYVIESLGTGGAELFIQGLASSLKSRGCVVEVAYLFGPDNLIDDFHKKGVPTHNLRVHRYGLVLTVWKIIRLVQSGGFNLVHAHLFHAALPVALSRFFIRSCPAVLTLHNTMYDAHPPNTLLKRFTRYLDGVLTRRLFDCCLAVSNAVAESARRHLNLSNVRVVSNGIDLHAIDEALTSEVQTIRRSYSVSVDALVVILPGRLAWEKGHHVLLSAWETIQEAVPQAVGIIVGDGLLRDDLVRQANSIRSAVHLHFYPAMAQDDLFRLMHASDVVAVPSISEGWGLVAAEAMALGKPVVCSDAGGLPEVMSGAHKRWIVPVNDSMALSNALIELLQNAGLRKKIGCESREYARQNYSIDSVVEEHLNIYTELLELKNS